MLQWFQTNLGKLADRGLSAIIILVIGILAIKLVMKLANNALSKTKLEKSASHLLLSVLKAVLYLLLFLSIAKALGIDMTGLVALASVLTLAVSLSLQNALTNIFSGFTLLYNKPFVSGDVVEIGGNTGTVKEIDLTYTKLVTPDNKTISIPNSSVCSSQIVNYTTQGSRRVDITVTASYDAPTQVVLDALKEAADLPTVLKDPAPFAGVSSYGDSAIEYALQVWCSCPDYITTLFGVNQKIKDVFDAKNIEMTYPHLNVHLDK